LTSRQELAAFAMACGRKLTEAAADSGAGVRTIKRWSATLPAFRRRINQYHAEMVETAMGRLADNMTSAADTLGYLCRKSKNESVRLGAARAILELGVKLRENVEHEERIAALESRAGGRASR
jgi:hypothetical protein